MTEGGLITRTRRLSAVGTAGRGLGLRALALSSTLMLAASACATATAFRVPDGPWTPDPSAGDAFEAASAPCRSVRTLTAEVAVRGRAGTTKIRGRIIAGFERGGALRFEAPAPFGAPIFVLAARANRGTLWLPRARQVVRDAPVDEVLEALTGLRRSADDILALLAGCPPDANRAAAGASGRRNHRGWLDVELGDSTRAFLRREAGAWRIVAARRDATERAGAWSVTFSDFISGRPRTISVWQENLSPGRPPTTSALTLAVFQPDVNVPIDPAAFDLVVPADTQPLSLDELRQTGPLAERGDDGGGVR